METIMFIKKNFNAKLFECGQYNGYVAIPPTNKNYGQSDRFLYGICVHGGVTFSSPACHKKLNGMGATRERNKILDGAIFLDGVQDVPSDWWIIGFDTCHCGDTPDKWTKEAVEAETRELSEELLK